MASLGAMPSHAGTSRRCRRPARHMLPPPTVVAAGSRTCPEFVGAIAPCREGSIHLEVDKIRGIVSRRRVSRMGEIDHARHVSLALQMPYNPDRIRPSRPVQ